MYINKQYTKDEKLHKTTLKQFWNMKKSLLWKTDEKKGQKCLKRKKSKKKEQENNNIRRLC